MAFLALMNNILTQVTSVFGPFVNEQIKRTYNFIKHYHRNIKEVKEKYEDLCCHKDTIIREIQIGKNLLHEVTPVAQSWLEKVESLGKEKELEELMNDERRKKKDKSYSGVFAFNLYQRYKMSKLANKKVKQIQEYLKDIPVTGRVTQRIDINELESLPSGFLHGLASRETYLQQVLDKLKDDDVGVVAICGMPGIGKSTLAREIKDKEAKRIFGTIVMAEISENPNIQCIQDHIASQIDLILDNNHPMDVRARFLRSALMKRVEPKEEITYNKVDKRRRKLLIILDNIWNKLDLNQVGIPFPNDTRSSFWCKILLTSREKDACKQMAVEEENIIDVKQLTDDESRRLFWEQVGEVNDRAKMVLEDKLWKRCQGLPLAIITLANSLKGQDMYVWERYATELQKLVLMQDTYIMNNQIKTIIETSYKFLKNQQKREFFLLVCLFPKGSSIQVEQLMRYGVGLGLFQYKNTVVEAMDQANAWVNELISSSLLIPDDTEHHFGRQVKVNDVVWTSALSFAEKDKRLFLVEAMPKLHLKETYKKYTAISLMPGQDHSRLKGMELEKLQMLLLTKSQPSEVDDSFFEGMMNLKVLALSSMNFSSNLPNSTTRLRNMRTLQLENCKLQDIAVIGVLEELIVLSLRNSTLPELQEEVKNLTRLQLLDLTCCRLSKIPTNVIATLTQLHALYMLFVDYKDDNNKTSVVELGSLRELMVLEIQVAQITQLPIDDKFLVNSKSLNEFFICVGTQLQMLLELQHPKQCSRVLWLESVPLASIWDHKCLKMFLPKTERLVLNKIQGLRNLVPLDKNVIGFSDLKYLQISDCAKLDCLINKDCPPNRLPMFMLTNLQELRLCDLEMLSYALPIHLVQQLTIVSVSRCNNLSFIFVEHRQNTFGQVGKYVIDKKIIQLPLKKLHLSDLPLLQSMLGEVDSLGFNNQALFSGKMIFPSLEELLVKNCSIIENLFDFPSMDGVELSYITISNINKKLVSSPFQNLKYITISKVQGLESLFSPSIATTLVQLEDLSVSRCQKMKDIISKEMKEDKGFANMIIFPNLKYLLLSELGNLKYFYGGNYEVQFPALKELKLNALGTFEVFSGVENCRSFFHGKMVFPSLEELWTCQINSEEHKELWTLEKEDIIIDPIPQLKLLELLEGSTKPTDWGLFKRVRYLSIGDINWEYIFELDDLSNSNNSLQFEIFEIRDCKNLKTVIKGDKVKGEIIEGSSSDIELPNLKRIATISCDKMESFYSSYSKGKGDVQVLKLPSLEKVRFEDCKSMKIFSYGPLETQQSIKFQFSLQGEILMGEIDDINGIFEHPTFRNVKIPVPVRHVKPGQTGPKIR